MQSEGIIVLGGDFNLLMEEKMDSQSSRKHKAQKDAHLMRTFSKDMGLFDVWQTLNPTQRDYTYHSPVIGNYSRLDYFFSVNKNPLVLLLGKLPENIGRNDIYLFLIIRVPLIKQITRNWLKDDNLIPNGRIL